MDPLILKLSHSYWDANKEMCKWNLEKRFHEINHNILSFRHTTIFKSAFQLDLIELKHETKSNDNITIASSASTRVNQKLLAKLSKTVCAFKWSKHKNIKFPLCQIPIASFWCAILKRPGLCGSLRPTQFKPRLDWVGSAAQARRYCVDSAAQAFIHALASCVPRSLQYALCGPRKSRSAHFAAHALNVLVTHESPSLTQLST